MCLGGLCGMVYEYLSGCFIPNDPSSRFLKLFQAVVVVARGDVFRSMAPVLGVNILLAMVKDTGGIYPIAIGKVFLQLINCSIVLQFQGPFQKHLSLHQFGMSTLRGCETIFLASEPSSTYILIGLWCKLMLNMLLIMFFKLLFVKKCEMLGDFPWTLSPFTTINHGLFY